MLSINKYQKLVLLILANFLSSLDVAHSTNQSGSGRSSRAQSTFHIKQAKLIWDLAWGRAFKRFHNYSLAIKFELRASIYSFPTLSQQTVIWNWGTLDQNSKQLGMAPVAVAEGVKTSWRGTHEHLPQARPQMLCNYFSTFKSTRFSKNQHTHGFIVFSHVYLAGRRSLVNLKHSRRPFLLQTQALILRKLSSPHLNKG